MWISDDEAGVVARYNAMAHLDATCLICLEVPRATRANDAADDVRVRRCDDCDALFCGGCYRLYVTHKIVNGQVAPHQLVCPGPCRRPISRIALAQVVSASLVQKYVLFLEAYEHRQRGHRFCPRPQCGQLLPSPKARQKKTKRRVECNRCRHASCRDCGGAYHRWPQCDRAYQSWCHAHAAQRCPLCSATIEKHGGCNHMTCTHCYYQFCWRCHSKWDDHNTALCWPLAYLRSKHKLFGPIAPVRLVTKAVVGTVGAGVAVVAGAVAVGVAAAALPPLAVYYGVRALRHH
ncbi:hypothetical protein SPRG_13646 [Saprolegnia parasitica CBS 223.65]|uniref:RBR-type E3 ubiquitin transferase n=1 Tax=Saprolegnia parasitica (strain CBS 223.65) TaxID=695850 RepID=A0A067C2Q7_SAPPC|nr:hypothetical protein SPRG_13646 [Saprolegnia parasitica CBS 223.65]KDO20831.1 hypothetical protein SPRG_13646 [Saprolegnia parasitica CBS 223.65]|eukprot:XP_012208489.1 hypothetical protein SPRG_13646 [Saprolegnia parasitica CBS 223.65]